MLRAFLNNPIVVGFNVELSSKSTSFDSTCCQIVKELVDNAVDSFANQSTSNGGCNSITISLDQTSDNNFLILTVTDNGAGFDNLVANVNAFQSTKIISTSSTSAPTPTVGKYGIGLTLAILYTFFHTLTPASISTTTGE